MKGGEYCNAAATDKLSFPFDIEGTEDQDGFAKTREFLKNSKLVCYGNETKK